MLGIKEQILSYLHCNILVNLRNLWEKLRMMLYVANMGTMVEYEKMKENIQVLHHALHIIVS